MPGWLTVDPQAGQKWNSVRLNAVPRYFICNADESEPGTIKDRVILEGDPYALIESMIIAAFATGCEEGYLYIRGEYSLGAEDGTCHASAVLADCLAKTF